MVHRFCSIRIKLGSCLLGMIKASAKGSQVYLYLVQAHVGETLPSAEFLFTVFCSILISSIPFSALNILGGPFSTSRLYADI